GVPSLVFSPDGTRVYAVVASTTYGLPVDGSTPLTFQGGQDSTVAVSPDGHALLVTAKEGLYLSSTTTSATMIRDPLPIGPTAVYRVSSGMFARSLSTAGDVGSIGFSPDGTLAAVAGFYLSVSRVSDWTEVLHVDQVHTVYTPDLSFSPDSKSVATAGDE